MNDSPLAAPATAPVSSFFGRMTNVYSSPSQLFTEVASAPPQVTSWLIPYIISLLLGVLITFALYNNPTIRQQIFDTREKAMKQAVTDGKMTQEQYDRASSQMESVGAGMFMAFGAIGAGVMISAFYFLGSLAVWLTAKIALKFQGSYMKILEIFGLISLIGIVGSIIMIIMMSMMNSLYATPSGAMFILDSFDPMNKAHKLLAALNVFTVWQVIVLGIGVSKVSGKTNGSGIGLVAALWALWVIVSTFLGLGM